MADRPAEEILKELKAVKAPVLDRTKTKDQAYVQDYVKQIARRPSKNDRR